LTRCPSCGHFRRPGSAYQLSALHCAVLQNVGVKKLSAETLIGPYTVSRALGGLPIAGPTFDKLCAVFDRVHRREAAE
jgi:hypothetical protein